MDNSKYVFEMKENAPVRTSDASKGHEVVVYAEQVLKEMGKNNSTGKYDKVVQGVRSLLGQSLLDGDKLKNAVRQEVERLLKKYNPNDAKPLHEMNTNELRDLAVSLGADKNKLYGTSKQALIIIIDKLKREKSNDMRTVDALNEVESKGPYMLAKDYNGDFVVLKNGMPLKRGNEQNMRKLYEQILKANGYSKDSQSVFDKAIRSCDDEDPISYAKKLMSECDEMNRRMAKLRTEASSKLNEFRRAILKYGMDSKEAENYKTAIGWINNIRNLWS